MTPASDGRPQDRLSKLVEEGQPELPKRFYDEVSWRAADDGTVLVLLDGRQVRTPGKRVLAVPARALAEDIAHEWRAQSERIDPTTMPLTRLANSVIDGVAQQMDAVCDDLVGYAGSDLVCYRATSPQGLVARQNAAWNPVLDWAERELAARFAVVEGIMPIDQPGAAIAAYRGAISGLDAFRLGALHVMVTLTGSALLALAHGYGALSADEAWQAAHVDEDWQISQWGHDAEAAVRRSARKADFLAASRMFQACSVPV